MVEHLREDGHEVLYVAEMEPGVSDDEVLELANLKEIPLLTTDRDFGKLVFRQGRLHSSVILVRLSNRAKANTVAAATDQNGAEYPGAFAVITPSAVRFRKDR